MLPVRGAGTVAGVFANLAEALSGSDPNGFLGQFESQMPGYAALEENIRALIAQADLSSSVEVVGDEGDDAVRKVEVDWMLEISSRAIGNPVERRHQTLRATLRKNGKGWRITALEPLTFFRAS